jgi:hypothetical protein
MKLCHSKVENRVSGQNVDTAVVGRFFAYVENVPVLTACQNNAKLCCPIMTLSSPHYSMQQSIYRFGYFIDYHKVHEVLVLWYVLIDLRCGALVVKGLKLRAGQNSLMVWEKAPRRA